MPGGHWHAGAWRGQPRGHQDPIPPHAPATVPLRRAWQPDQDREYRDHRPGPDRTAAPGAVAPGRTAVGGNQDEPADGLRGRWGGAPNPRLGRHAAWRRRPHRRPRRDRGADHDDRAATGLAGAARRQRLLRARRAERGRAGGGGYLPLRAGRDERSISLGAWPNFLRNAWLNWAWSPKPAP